MCQICTRIDQFHAEIATVAKSTNRPAEEVFAAKMDQLAVTDPQFAADVQTHMILSIIASKASRSAPAYPGPNGPRTIGFRTPALVS